MLTFYFWQGVLMHELYEAYPAPSHSCFPYLSLHNPFSTISEFTQPIPAFHIRVYEHLSVLYIRFYTILFSKLYTTSEFTQLFQCYTMFLYYHTFQNIYQSNFKNTVVLSVQ